MQGFDFRVYDFKIRIVFLGFRIYNYSFFPEVQHNFFFHFNTRPSCKACPHFGGIDAFAQSTLPRLHTLRVYGAVSCPEEDSALVQRGTLELTCFHRNLPEECDSVPQWMLEDNVETAASATLTGCFEPICGSLTEAYTYFDMNADSLIDTDEFRRHLYIVRGALGPRTYTDSGLLCLFDKIRSAIILAPTAPPGAVLADGLTLPEFLAYATSYSNCLECPKTQETMAKGLQNWLSRQEQTVADPDVPEECTSIGLSYTPARTQEYCQTTVTDCQIFCEIYLEMYVQFDKDGDGFLSEQDLIDLATAAGYEQRVASSKLCL